MKLDDLRPFFYLRAGELLSGLAGASIGSGEPPSLKLSEPAQLFRSGERFGAEPDPAEPADPSQNFHAPDRLADLLGESSFRRMGEASFSEYMLRPVIHCAYGKRRDCSTVSIVRGGLEGMVQAYWEA